MFGGGDGSRRSGRRRALLVCSLVSNSVVAFQTSPIQARSAPRRRQHSPPLALHDPASTSTDFTAFDLILPADPVQHFFTADLLLDETSIGRNYSEVMLSMEPIPPTTLPSIDMLERNGLVSRELSQYKPTPPKCPPPTSIVARAAWDLPRHSTSSSVTTQRSETMSQLACLESMTFPPLDPRPPPSSTLSFRTIVRQLRTLFSAQPPKQDPISSSTMEHLDPPHAVLVTDVTEAIIEGALSSPEQVVWEPRPPLSRPPLTNLLPAEREDPVAGTGLVSTVLEPHPPRLPQPMRHLLLHTETNTAVEVLMERSSDTVAPPQSMMPSLDNLLEPSGTTESVLMEPRPPRSRPPVHHLLVPQASNEEVGSIPARDVTVVFNPVEHQQHPDLLRSSSSLVHLRPSETCRYCGETEGSLVQTKTVSSSAMILHPRHETLLHHTTATHIRDDLIASFALDRSKICRVVTATALSDDDASLGAAVPASAASATKESNESSSMNSNNDNPALGVLEPGDPGVPPPPSTTTTMEEDNNGHNNDHPSEFLSFKAQRNVPCQTVIGAALAGYLCATTISHDSSAIGPAAVVGFAALTRGTVGDTTRVVGDWFWSVTRLSFATVSPVAGAVQTATRAAWDTVQSVAEAVYATYTWAAAVQELQEARGVAIQKERKVRKLLQAQLEQSERDRLRASKSAVVQERPKRRMKFRFGVSAEERRKEESRAQERLMVETRRDIMAYRFQLESQQRENARQRKEVALIQARQKRMAFRFRIESAARSRGLIARRRNEKIAKEFQSYQSHRELMMYRFEIEAAAREKQAALLQAEIQNMRDTIVYNMHRHMLTYRLFLEAKQRRRRLEAQEQSFVRSHQNLLTYRLRLEATLRDREIINSEFDQGLETSDGILSKKEGVDDGSSVEMEEPVEIADDETNTAISKVSKDVAPRTLDAMEELSASEFDEFDENNDVARDAVTTDTTPQGEMIALQSSSWERKQEDPVSVDNRENTIVGGNPERNVQVSFESLTAKDRSRDIDGVKRRDNDFVDSLEIVGVAGSAATTKGGIRGEDKPKTIVADENASIKTRREAVTTSDDSSTAEDKLNDDEFVFETTKLSRDEGMDLREAIVVSSSASSASSGRDSKRNDVKTFPGSNKIDFCEPEDQDVAREGKVVSFSETGVTGQTGSEAQTEQNVGGGGGRTLSDTSKFASEPKSSTHEQDIEKRKRRELMRRILKSKTKVDRSLASELPRSKAPRTSLVPIRDIESDEGLTATMKNFLAPSSLPNLRGRALEDEADLSELEMLQKSIEGRHLQRAKTPYARRARRLRTYLKQSSLPPSTPLVQLVALHFISASAPLFTMINYRNGRKPYL